MKNVAILIALAVASVLVILLGSVVGLQDIDFDLALNDSSSTDHRILWKMRVPRVLLAYSAGLGLSICGVVFQAIFRNPIATPFTLGVASGASLGAALATHFGIAFTVGGFSSNSIFAFIGALGTIAIVFGVARIRGGFSNTTLLLTGVAISYFFSSLILFLQSITNPYNAIRILHWIMGGLGGYGYSGVINVFPFVSIGGLVIIAYTHHLNLLTTGDDIATSRGIDVPRTKKILFLVTSVIVGGIVAECGPIGFLGLMCPHIVRLLIGADHRYLVPGGMLFGGVFLTLCDTLSLLLPVAHRVPVGVLTSLMGGPFFLWLLLRRRREFVEFG